MFDRVSEQFFREAVRKLNSQPNNLMELVDDESSERTIDQQSIFPINPILRNPFDEDAFEVYDNVNENLIDQTQEDVTVDINLITKIKHYLMSNNPFASELISIGNIVSSLPNGTSTEVRAGLSGTAQFFDVAHITSDTAQGPRVLNIISKDIIGNTNR
jgi:hypothetical protein